MRARSQHRSKYWKQVKVFLIALGIIGFGMVVPKAFSFVAQVILYPVHAVSVWLEESSSVIPTFIRDRQSLQAEIEDLKTEIEIVSRAELTQLRLQEENNRLRSLLGAETEERVAAAIIARPADLPYDLVQIDQGINSGIQVGAPVFIGSDIVIGLVVHTAADYSFVQLITTPGFVATAFISGPNVVVDLEGLGGGVARVKVPQGISLAEGNLVYLPSVNPGVFGRIALIENEPTQPEQFGYITPDIPIASLFEVAVGKQSQITKSTDEIEKNITDIINRQLVVEDVYVATSTEATSTAEVSTEEDI